VGNRAFGRRQAEVMSAGTNVDCVANIRWQAQGVLSNALIGVIEIQASGFNVQTLARCEASGKQFA
jgi:hypothetical protein